MHLIDAPGHDNNSFTDGDPGNGIPATDVWSKWLNMIQGELKAFLDEVNVNPDDADNTQVLAAVLLLIRNQLQILDSIDGDVELRHEHDYTALTDFSFAAETTTGTGLAIDSNDAVWIPTFSGEVIYKYTDSGSGYTYTGTSFNVGTEITTLWVCAIDSADAIWAVDDSSGVIYKYMDSGSGYTYASKSLDTTNEIPAGQINGLAFDSADIMYVVSGNDSRVYIYSLSGSDYVYSGNYINVSDQLDNANPQDIAFESADNLWLTDFEASGIKRLHKYTDSGGGFIYTGQSIKLDPAVTDNNADSVDFDSGDNLFIRDYGDAQDKVQIIDVLNVTEAVLTNIGKMVEVGDNLDFPADLNKTVTKVLDYNTIYVSGWLTEGTQSGVTSRDQQTGDRIEWYDGAAVWRTP